MLQGHEVVGCCFAACICGWFLLFWELVVVVPGRGLKGFWSACVLCSSTDGVLFSMLRWICRRCLAVSFCSSVVG